MTAAELIEMAKSQLVIRGKMEAFKVNQWKVKIILCHCEGNDFHAATYTDKGERTELEECPVNVSLHLYKDKPIDAAQTILEMWERAGESVWFAQNQYELHYIVTPIGTVQITNCHYLLLQHYPRLELLLAQRWKKCPLMYHRFAAAHQRMNASWLNFAAIFQHYR